MEKTRISPPAPQGGTHETRGARGATGQPGVRNDAQGAAQGDGFALLLAALGAGADTGVDMGANMAADAGDTLAGGEGAPGMLFAADVPPDAALQNTLLTDGLEAPDASTLAALLAGSPDGMARLAAGAAAAAAGDAAPATPTAPTAPTAPDASTLAALLAGLQPGGAGQPSANLAGLEPDALAARTGLGLVRQGRETLVGQTAQLDATVQGQDAGTARARAAAPAGRGGVLARAGWSAQDATAGAQQGVSGSGRSARGQSGAEAGLERATAQAAVQAAAQTSAAARPGGAAVAQPVADLAAPGLAAAGVGAGALAAAMGAAMGAASGSAAGGGAQAQHRGGEASGAPQGVAPQPPQAFESADAAPVPGEAAQAGMDGAEDALSEQMAYWVHQDTQNAELTLDQGGQPVEVKVALKGDEAHVTFRSDQAEERQLLDTSAAELRAALQREGLQLAGVTVGASGSGDSSRQGARDDGRRNARQASVQAAAPAGAAAARGVGERSVDIFV